MQKINQAHKSKQKLFYQLVNSNKTLGPGNMSIQRGKSVAETTPELLVVWTDHFATLAKPSDQYNDSFKEQASAVVEIAESIFQHKTITISTEEVP